MAWFEELDDQEIGLLKQTALRTDLLYGIGQTGVWVALSPAETL
jgi:hypothetical protein